MAPRSRRGFSLLEVTLGVGLAATMILAVAFATERTNSAYEVARDEQALRMDAHRMLASIEERLRDVNRQTLDPKTIGPYSSEMTFSNAVGSNEGAGPIWGAERRIELQLERGEIDDDLDNNGNGLIDECVVVQFDDVGLASERSFVLAHDVRDLHAGETANGLDDNGNGLVDEPGLCFELAGDLLTIRLSVERMGRYGDTLSAAAETAIRVRNSDNP